jgi:hypothetical protein
MAWFWLFFAIFFLTVASVFRHLVKADTVAPLDATWLSDYSPGVMRVSVGLTSRYRRLRKGTYILLADPDRIQVVVENDWLLARLFFPRWCLSRSSIVGVYEVMHRQFLYQKLSPSIRIDFRVEQRVGTIIITPVQNQFDWVRAALEERGWRLAGGKSDAIY